MKKKPIIFTHDSGKITYRYPSGSLNRRVIPFFLTLLHSKGSKNIYLFTYNLTELFSRLIEEVPTGIICKKFEYNGTRYMIRIYRGDESSPSTYLVLPNKDMRGRVREIIIINLEQFGQSDIDLIKKDPNNFIKLLKDIKKQMGVNVNNKYRLSIPSVAAKIFKEMYPFQHKRIPRLRYNQDTFIRQGYIGGRTEVFQPIVDETNYYYDVNSLYPYIMKTMPMPLDIL